MAVEQPPKTYPPSEWPGATRPHPARRRKGRNWLRFFVGAVTLFIVMSVLYGPNQAMTVVALLVVCTVGLGLIPIVFVSWLVGAVVVAVWDALNEAAGDRGPTAPQDAAGS